ncbi:MAG: hypothetical protein ACRC8Y_24345 [Chroococcales cyanobacterium]
MRQGKGQGKRCGGDRPPEILPPLADDIEPPMIATGSKTGIFLQRERTVVCANNTPSPSGDRFEWLPWA